MVLDDFLMKQSKFIALKRGQVIEGLRCIKETIITSIYRGKSARIISVGAGIVVLVA
jgi:hypothetical protein